MSILTPKEIVAELDKYIVGQTDAKKLVAVALRNRWRRQQLQEDLREEIVPKNILMIGPTGVGKTEIARRLAKLSGAPFTKVEATKFTEIGYVGRDVESIIRDLLDISIASTREKLKKQMYEKAQDLAKERIIAILVGDIASPETKEKFRQKYENGLLDDKEIEIQVEDHHSESHMPSFEIPGMPGAQMGMFNMADLMKSLTPRFKTKKISVKEAFDYFVQEEGDKLLDNEIVRKEAISAVEQNGIVFIDEIDKICSKSDRQSEISREGVQRDLLPLIEGTSVATKHGFVKTDHILFIASGAFHVSKPSDLLPELQGRLPTRVELKALTKDDFVKILTQTQANLIMQYQALMKTEGLDLEFTSGAIEEIAIFAAQVNKTVENIGARRLHTIMEKTIESLSFDAPDKKGEKVIIDGEYVKSKVSDLVINPDLSRFIL